MKALMGFVGQVWACTAADETRPASTATVAIRLILIMTASLFAAPATAKSCSNSHGKKLLYCLPSQHTNA
jgi:hypothetical protein